MMTERYDYRGRFEVEENLDRQGFPRRYFMRLSCPEKSAPDVGVELPVGLYQDFLDRHNGQSLEARVNIIVGNSLSRVELDILVPHREMKKVPYRIPGRHDYEGGFEVEENRSRKGFPLNYFIRLRCPNNGAPPLGVELPVDLYQDMIDRHNGLPLEARGSVIISNSMSRLELDIFVPNKDLKKP